MWKRFLSLALLTVLLLCAVSARADVPKPIEIIPYDQLPEPIDGQHHYLLLCVDQWSKKPDNLGNTDGIVVVTFDTRAHRIMLTSVIRDALVQGPDGKPTRVTYVAHRNNNDPAALCRVLSQHLGIRVEKYILFNWSQVQSIIDYLGGVDITVTNEEAAYLKRYAIPRDSTTPRMANAGTYHFRGHSAVIYMRIRKAGGGGDFMRTQRVRNVLSTLADNCREITYEDARALVDEVLDQSTLTNMSLNDMLEAMDQAFMLRGCTMEELRIPISGTAHGIDYGGSVQEIDWAANRVAMDDYLQNSYLVLNEADDDFGDFIFGH